MTDTVEVKLGAQTAPATSGMQSAASSIDGSLKAISTALEKFSTSSERGSREVQRHNKETEVSFLRMHESLKNGFSASMTTLELFRSRIGAFAGLFAGGAIFRGAVESVTHLADEVRKLENVFGMASDKATTYATALKLIGKNADDFAGMAFKLARQVKGNEQNLNQLGIVTRDTAGHLLQMDVIMQNAFTTMQDYKAGADQDLFALNAFGRSANDVFDYVTKLNPAIQRATELNRELGIEMGPKRQAEIAAYKRELNATKIVFEALSERIGEALLPTLKAFAGWMNDTGPNAIKVFEFALKGLMTVFEWLGAGVGVIVIKIAQFWDDAKAIATGAWATIKATIAGNYLGAYRAVQDTNAQLVSNSRAAFDAIASAGDRLRGSLSKIWGEHKPGSDVGPGPMKSGNRTMPQAAGKEPESVMGALEGELERQKYLYERMKLEQGSFEKWSLEQTRNYWGAATLLQGISAKDREEIEKKYYQTSGTLLEQQFHEELAALEEQKQAAKFNSAERIRIAEEEARRIAKAYGEQSVHAREAYRKVTEEYQRAAEQRARIAEIEQRSMLATSKFSVDMARMNADQQLALQQISVQQKLALEREFVAREREIDTQAIRERIALMQADPFSDPAKLAELKAQLLVVEQNYQKQLTAIDNQAVLDRKQYALQAADAIRSSMETLLQSLGDRTKTWAQKLKDAVASLTAELNKIASQQIVKQLFGAGTSGGNFLSGLTDRIFGKGALGSLGGGGEGAAAQAATTSLTALSGTTDTASSTLSILDTVSQTLQTAFITLQSAAEQASASLMSMGGGGGFGGGGGMGDLFGSGLGDAGSMFGFPMFDVGTPYVPNDMLAVVHKGEAIVPAKYNQGGGSGGAMTVNNKFYFSGPVDTRTQDQVAATAARSIQRARMRNL